MIVLLHGNCKHDEYKYFPLNIFTIRLKNNSETKTYIANSYNFINYISNICFMIIYINSEINK